MSNMYYVELACILSKHSYMYGKHCHTIHRLPDVPACTAELEWTGSGEPKSLSHQVKISGAKRNWHTSIYLHYYPQAVGEFYFCPHMHMHVYVFEFHFITILVIRYFSCHPCYQGNECIVHI